MKTKDYSLMSTYFLPQGIATHISFSSYQIRNPLTTTYFSHLTLVTDMVSDAQALRTLTNAEHH
jgi:hypothetical protein